MKNVYRVVGLCVIGCAGSVARAQWAVTILDTSEGTNPDSMVTCGIGSTQAGWGPFPLQGTHASVWSGAPGTQTSLKPPMNGVSFSGITAMSETAQVGGMLFFTGTGYARPGASAFRALHRAMFSRAIRSGWGERDSSSAMRRAMASEARSLISCPITKS